MRRSAPAAAVLEELVVFFTNGAFDERKKAAGAKMGFLHLDDVPRL
jgi:hypothetical protein